MTETTKAKEPVFDVNRPIEIKLQSAEGVKALTVRFPTDAEWIERQRRRKIIIKQLGRGTSETIVPGSEDIDAELVAKLRSDGGGGAEIDGFEATRILEQLSQADVDDVVPEAGAFLVKLRVPGGITSHNARMPSAKEIIEYRRAFARVLDLPFNKQSLTVNLGTAGDLYGKLCPTQNEDYAAGAVPIIHRAMVVKAAIDALESGLGVSEPENF
jgi:hypothetical protein